MSGALIVVGALALFTLWLFVPIPAEGCGGYLLKAWLLFLIFVFPILILVKIY